MTGQEKKERHTLILLHPGKPTDSVQAAAAVTTATNAHVHIHPLLVLMQAVHTPPTPLVHQLEATVELQHKTRPLPHCCSHTRLLLLPLLLPAQVGRSAHKRSRPNKWLLRSAAAAAVADQARR